MSDADILFDEVYRKYLVEVKTGDLESKETTTAIQNLKTFTECRPPLPEPEPEVTPEPTTVWGKLKAGSAGIWASETTRVLIKAGGAFAGVALVTWTTIHRDHVIAREAQTQANQRND